MSRINVEFIAFGDVRFTRLAQLMGYADHDHARSKVEYLWMECTKRGTAELPQWVVESLLGASAVDALVASELARFTRGRGDSNTRLMRISGASDRCLWMARNKEQSSKGGKSRAVSAQRSAGRFAPAAAGGVPPAQTSPLTPTLTPILSEEELRPAPEIPAPALSLAAEPPEPSGHKAVVAAFDAAFRAQNGVSPTWGKRQGAQVRDLIEKHSAVEVQRRIGVLFGSPPPWLSPPFDLGTLVQHFDKLAAPSRSPPSKTPALPVRRLERL